MRRLGAILAGGQSRRFGSDKAVAIVGGRTLIDRVAAALAPQVDAIVVVGRELADRPAPGLGPLGGLCAALDHARAHGFDAVLTAGCDVLPVPADLAVRLAPGPAVIDGQPLFGLWPATLAARLDAHLAAGGDRSLRRWVAATGARRVALAAALFNLNTPADLALYCETEGPGR